MAESNLFEIEVADEFKTTLAEPTPWLKSLPLDRRMTKLQNYLNDLQAEYDMVADAAEQARVSLLMGAARNYLKEIGG